MMRRKLEISGWENKQNNNSKPQDYSPSTQDSGSPRNFAPTTTCKSSIRKDKEKSQLCKKYLEFGFCPYEKKCKFAHGSHELRKNHQVNSKYKTKECGVYLTEGSCMYGQRCNFIHKKVSPCTQSPAADAIFQQVKAEARLQSRLLGLLGLPDSYQ